MSTSASDFNAQIIEEFRANEGRVGGPFEGLPLLLLHHTGAKSGKRYINPLAYQADNGRYVIFASKGGAPTNPGWYYNLRANPDTTIEVGTETIPVNAKSENACIAARLLAFPRSPRTSRRPAGARSPSSCWTLAALPSVAPRSSPISAAGSSGSPRHLERKRNPGDRGPARRDPS
jgi:deazaflavin-dependent oxidoreductase (nitroreductase family)